MESNVVINEPLCFLINRVGKSTDKIVKQVLHDFYDAGQLTSAKNQLCEDIEKLNLDKWTKPRRHQDNDGRALKEVDDLFSMFTFVDERGATSKLPIVRS